MRPMLLATSHRPIYTAFMKTTVDISDPLLRQARTVAAKRGTTLRALVEQGLRQVIDGKPAKPFKLKDGSFKGKGLSPQAAQLAGPNLEKIRYLAYEPSPEDGEK
jgi:hypothetical protein